MILLWFWLIPFFYVVNVVEGHFRAILHDGLDWDFTQHSMVKHGDLWLVGCQPDESHVSLATTNRIVNVYDFIFAVLFLI